MVHTATHIMDMFNYEFMRNAFYAGAIVAIVAALVGYFIVIRNLAFAGHALSHVSFAGAAAAGLLGISQLNGQMCLTILAALGMGALGHRINKSDIVIGVILAFSLGLGVLFLSFYNSYAGQAMSILFGDILGVSHHLLKQMLIFSIPCLLALGIIARPLLFASLEPELAEAKGVSLTLTSTLFMLIMAIAVAEVCQVVGILLVFALLIGPAAAAINWTRHFWSGISLALVLAVITVWLGIILAYYTDWPAVFWISAASLIVYLLSLYKN